MQVTKKEKVTSIFLNSFVNPLSTDYIWQLKIFLDDIIKLSYLRTEFIRNRIVLICNLEMITGILFLHCPEDEKLRLYGISWGCSKQILHYY